MFILLSSVREDTVSVLPYGDIATRHHNGVTNQTTTIHSILDALFLDCPDSGTMKNKPLLLENYLASGILL